MEPFDKLKFKCCSCQQPITGTLNMIVTEYEQTWKFPKAGNILTGDSYGAIAVVGDECIGKPIVNVIELKDGEIIYHQVKDLKKRINIRNN